MRLFSQTFMKTRIRLLLIAALSLPLNAGAVELFTFYAECELGLIDTTAGTSTPVGTIGWSVEAMDYGPDGQLYATVENGCWTHGNAGTLAIIDPVTLTVTPIGPIDPDGLGFGDVDALAFSPSGDLFAISVASYQLITIDPFTGAGTAIGYLNDLPGTFLGAIDFLPDGRLIGIDMHDAGGGPSLVWEINTTDASATFIGPLGFGSVEGMSLGPDGQLYALANSMEVDEPAILVTVNPDTGAGTFVQDMPLPLPDHPGARDALVAIAASEVLIDIKPGSWPNSINTRNKGVIPVAILGSSDFDATQVDVTTVEFGPDGAAPVHDGHVDDVNNDGHPDFVVHFKTLDTGIACGDTDATLTGETFDETAIEGTDSVKTVGCTVPQTVYFNDFDGGLAVAPGVKDVLDGITTTEPAQGYSGVGSFGGDFLRNTTGGEPIGTSGEPTRLTLTKLPRHSSVNINFLLAIIDSWDGSLPGGCTTCHPDVFNVRVDGIAVFGESFGFNGPTFVPPLGVLLAISPLGFNSDFDDAVYDMGLNPTFDNIPHTARTLTIEWFADGAGWQGGDDESRAIDNLEIILNKV